MESCRIGIDRLEDHNSKENKKKKLAKVCTTVNDDNDCCDANGVIVNDNDQDHDNDQDQDHDNDQDQDHDKDIYNAIEVSQFNEMIDLIRFIGQNSIDARVTKKTKESNILSTIGRRRMVNSDRYGEKVVRCAINADGHCLFDSLAFLFLYCGHDTTVISYELISYGWIPCLSGFLSHGTCRGNMMDVLIINSEKIVESANLCPSDRLEVVAWFSDYSNHFGEIHEYPSLVIAYIVFRMLFKSHDVQLCMHQLSTWGDGQQYLDETVFIDSGGEMAYLPLNIVHIVKDKKKIHLWNCDTVKSKHFEPAILHMEQQEVNLSASRWITDMKQRMLTTGI